MIKVECSKCNGQGEIKAFSGIAGGICFACNGAGHKMQKAAPRKVLRFSVSAIARDTGERLTVFTVKAHNAAAALKIAHNQLKRGNGYLPDTAAVIA